MIQFAVTIYAVITLMLLLVRFERGLLFLLPLLPIAGYAYHSPITGLNMLNLLIYTAFAMGLFHRMSRRSESLPPSTLPLVSFFILTLISWVLGTINYSSEPSYSPVRWFINIERWAVFTLLYFAYYFGWSHRHPIEIAFRWMFIGVFMAAALNIGEIIRPTDYYLISGRAGGIFSQANSNGIFLASYGFLGLALAHSARTKAARWFYYGSFLLCIQGIFLSASRTGLLAFIFAGLAYAFFRSKRAFLATLLLLIMLLPVYRIILPEMLAKRIESTVSGSRYEGVAGELEGSAANRLVQNIAGVKLFLDSPILGHGLGGAYYRLPRYLPPGSPDAVRSLHSTFLWILVEMGIVTTACFLWFLWTIVREGKRLYQSDAREAERMLGLFLVVSMIAKVAANFVSTDFFTGDVSTYLWIAGALIALQNRHAAMPVAVKEPEQTFVLSTGRPRRGTPLGKGAGNA